MDNDTTTSVTSQSVKQLVNMACAYVGITHAELARRMGWSNQLLHSRTKAGKFSYSEWQHLASALGANLKLSFEFPDGKIIE